MLIHRPGSLLTNADLTPWCQLSTELVEFAVVVTNTTSALAELIEERVFPNAFLIVKLQ